MESDLDLITARLQQEKTAVSGIQNTSEQERLLLESFSHNATEMLGDFVTRMVDLGAPGAKLIPVTREKSKPARIGVRILDIPKSPIATKHELLDCSEVPGWRLGQQKSTNYAILATNDLIRENWATDKKPTVFIDPENYGTILTRIGICDVASLARRLHDIENQ